MKKESLDLSPQYIVDDAGNKTSVVIDIKTYQKIVEHLEDTYFGTKAKQALKEGEFVDFDEVNK